MKKRTEKKAKAKAPAEASAPHAGKPKEKTSDLPAREVLEGVVAIVLKKGKRAIAEGEVVYDAGKGIAIWSKAAKKRIAWIARARVIELVKA